MPNLTKSLLRAVQNEIQENSTFSYIEQCYVIQALQEEYIPDISTAPPFALVYPNPGSTFEPDCMGAESEQAVYLLGLSMFAEYWGADVGMLGDNANLKGATDFEIDIKSVFNQNRLTTAIVTRLGYASTYVPLDGRVLSANYSPMGFVRYNEQGLAQVHCLLQYHDQYYG